MRISVPLLHLEASMQQVDSLFNDDEKDRIIGSWSFSSTSMVISGLLRR